MTRPHWVGFSNTRSSLNFCLRGVLQVFSKQARPVSTERLAVESIGDNGWSDLGDPRRGSNGIIWERAALRCVRPSASFLQQHEHQPDDDVEQGVFGAAPHVQSPQLAVRAIQSFPAWKSTSGHKRSLCAPSPMRAETRCCFPDERGAASRARTLRGRDRARDRLGRLPRAVGNLRRACGKALRQLLGPQYVQLS